MDYLDENCAKIDKIPDLTNYAAKNEIPEVPTTLGQILPEDEVQPVSSVAVINSVSAQDFATVSQIPQTPTIEFKTDFIGSKALGQGHDLSTCWILLNVWHIEFNLILTGSGLKKVSCGYPVGTLKPDGIIYISTAIEVNSQINVSIFYTFTEYQTQLPEGSLVGPTCGVSALLFYFK
jgi:hypothetical protein